MTNRFAKFAFLLICLAPALPSPSPCLAATTGQYDASWQNTYDAFREVPCLNEDELAYGREVILGLDYNSRRIFRRIARMEGIDFSISRQAWSLLLELGLSFEQMLAFEAWSDAGDIDVVLGLDALVQIKTLGYEAGRAFSSYCALPRVTPEHALHIIPTLTRLTDAQNRAVRQMMSLPGASAVQAIDNLAVIARMGFHQSQCSEAFAQVQGMTSQIGSDALPLIRMLNMENAWNARAMYTSVDMKAEKAWFWLVAYFANPTGVQEQQFFTLSPADRNSLVRSLYDAGEEIIWKINNLHDVTDHFGLEISSHTLRASSLKWLRSRFSNLSPQVQSRYSERFYATKEKTGVISLLKKATASERSATARRLTMANIYALLAQGSELYDSSFRNILVPVLKERINRDFSGDLLHFLEQTDPANQLVSSFIVSLAQKGKLTTFFPADSHEQKRILDLVAHSAFLNEDSIILFSATFMHLLKVLTPEARSFLVERMQRQAEEGSQAYSRLITVILQYYLEEFPELLSDKDKLRIRDMLDRFGAVNLLAYLATPFSSWKQDAKLASLSLFHPDDDGRKSFQSNARLLMQSGYRLALSDDFTVASLSEQQRSTILGIINTARRKPGTGLAALFKRMRSDLFAVSFSRTIQGLTIIHSTSVYTGEQHQANLLERFILSKAEMLAQRGHSYWRSEQITEPLETLKKSGRITDQDLQSVQRFLSLGSCGGVKAYTRLNRLFLGKVDILATIGSGLASINDPYNKHFFEAVAKSSSSATWRDLANKLAFIFRGGQGQDYLQPGSLPAILHKILDEEKTRAKHD